MKGGEEQAPPNPPWLKYPSGGIAKQTYTDRGIVPPTYPIKSRVGAPTHVHLYLIKIERVSFDVHVQVSFSPFVL